MDHTSVVSISAQWLKYIYSCSSIYITKTTVFKMLVKGEIYFNVQVTYMKKMFALSRPFQN